MLEVITAISWKLSRIQSKYVEQQEVMPMNKAVYFMPVICTMEDGYHLHFTDEDTETLRV